MTRIRFSTTLLLVANNYQAKYWANLANCVRYLGNQHANLQANHKEIIAAVIDKKAQIDELAKLVRASKK